MFSLRNKKNYLKGHPQNSTLSGALVPSTCVAEVKYNNGGARNSD